MNRYLLTAPRLLAGDGLELVENGAVAVEGDKILYAGSLEVLGDEYKDLERIHLDGCTLLPGMIDSHSHTALDARVEGHLEMMNDPAPDLTIRAVRNAEDDLLSGITTCRILGEKHYVDVSLRAAINSGILPGPHLLVAGIGMRSLHGHGFVGVPHTGRQEFRRTARENMLRKVEWLKIFVTGGTPPLGCGHIPSFVSLEEIEAVTAEAKRMGIRTSAHCIGGEGLVNCVKGGVDVIDHAYAATDEDLALIMEKDRWICLTPSVFMDLERNTKNPPAVAANTERTRQQVISVMEKIVSSGVKYAIGSDALHAHMPLEAKYAVQLGATNHRALAGVTIDGARLCGVEDVCGSLVKGKRADIIAVKGNPLETIGELANVEFVMKSGVRYR